MNSPIARWEHPPPRTDEFVGLDQYAQLFKDGNFWGSLLVTVVFAVVVVTVEFCLGLGLALLLATELRFRSLFRTGLMLPMVVMPVVVGIAWRLIFISNAGPVDSLARMVFGSPFNFLSNPGLALPAIMIVDIWNWTPFMMLVLLAGVQSLPLEPFEAAMVDGDNRLTAFYRIVLPLAAPVVATAIFSVITTYNEFLFALILTSTMDAMTLPVGAASLAEKTSLQIGQMAAIAALAIIPIMVFALIVQRHLVRGLTMGAVK